MSTVSRAAVRMEVQATVTRRGSGKRGTEPEVPVVSLRHTPSDKSKVPVSPSWSSVFASGSNG